MVASSVLLVIGTFFLVVGPAMQAYNEVHRYGQLRDALSAQAKVPEIKLTIAALRFALAITRNNPADAADAADRVKAAAEAIGGSPPPDKDVEELQTQIARARNWLIVMLGSTVAFAAALVEMVNRLNGTT